MGPVRVRFAPSPTGELHVGGARTALFNWLFARRFGGQFILRIEDTDQTRSREDLMTPIMDGLRWLGLQWDEGPDIGGPVGPYLQSRRLDLYRTYLRQLISTGKAYYCYCTPDELAEQRANARAAGKPYRYDRRCLYLTPEEQKRRLDEGRTPVVRLFVPDEGTVTVHDLIRGDVSFEKSLLDDFILVKSDGMPTYNFACVVDDHLMGITHVIRAEEHLSNTPKQMLLYEAFGWEMPAFAHVPMILAPDRTKLSKRHGAKGVGEYRQEGILAPALANYLALLGWSYDLSQEFFTLAQAAERFDITDVNKTAAIYNNDKLEWMNAAYIRSIPLEELAELAFPFFRDAGLLPAEPSEAEMAYFRNVLGLMRERFRTLREAVETTGYFFADEITVQPDAEARLQKDPGTQELLRQVSALLRELPDWDSGSIEQACRGLIAQLNIKSGDLIHPLRAAVTGRTVGAGLFETMAVMGRDRTLAHIGQMLRVLAPQ